MPQLNQLAEVANSQFFWLLLVLGIIYVGIGMGMLPKIQSTVADREKKIADDLKAAEAAQDKAEKVEEAYRERMDASRSEAAKLTSKAKADGAKSTEKTLAKADEEVAGKIEQAEATIRKARDAALRDIESTAAELAQDIAGKVAGMKVTKAKAADAVKAVMADA